MVSAIQQSTTHNLPWQEKIEMQLLLPFQQRESQAAQVFEKEAAESQMLQPARRENRQKRHSLLKNRKQVNTVSLS
jgi:hypothetical protein